MLPSGCWSLPDCHRAGHQSSSCSLDFVIYGFLKYMSFSAWREDTLLMYILSLDSPLYLKPLIQNLLEASDHELDWAVHQTDA